MSQYREKVCDVIAILAAVQSSLTIVNDDNHEANGLSCCFFSAWLAASRLPPRRWLPGQYNARLVELREGLDNLKRSDPEDG
jgi:hypothetical protein